MLTFIGCLCIIMLKGVSALSKYYSIHKFSKPAYMWERSISLPGMY